MSESKQNNESDKPLAEIRINENYIFEQPITARVLCTDATLTHDEIKTKFIEYARLYQRLQRNGDLEEKKVGRKSVSPEHKKMVYEKWLQKRKDQRRETAEAQGRVYARGRPVKIQSENLTCVQV
jgi:hypothetical protein